MLCPAFGYVEIMQSYMGEMHGLLLPICRLCAKSQRMNETRSARGEAFDVTSRGRPRT